MDDSREFRYVGGRTLVLLSMDAWCIIERKLAKPLFASVSKKMGFSLDFKWAWPGPNENEVQNRKTPPNNTKKQQKLLIMFPFVPFFPCAGVADGVGGWRSYGIDPGEFSSFLMRSCERLVETAKFNPKKPVSLLSYSYCELLEQKKPILGKYLCAFIHCLAWNRFVIRAIISSHTAIVISPLIFGSHGMCNSCRWNDKRTVDVPISARSSKCHNVMDTRNWPNVMDGWRDERIKCVHNASNAQSSIARARTHHYAIYVTNYNCFDG